MRKLLPILLVVLLFSSCTKLIFVLYGVKNPAIESEKSIRKSARKHQLDTADIITVRCAHYLREVKGKGIPNASVFDAQGNYIEYRSNDTACNAGLFDFIPKLSVQNTYNKTGETTLQKELAKYTRLNGDSVYMPQTADFYVLIYWTVWSGRLNKDHVKIWEDLAKQNKTARVKVIKANLDLQANWNTHERDSF
jgi:hypothetical protein